MITADPEFAQRLEVFLREEHAFLNTLAHNVQQRRARLEIRALEAGMADLLSELETAAGRPTHWIWSDEHNCWVDVIP